MTLILIFISGVLHRLREVQHIWGFYYPNRQWRYNSGGDKVYFHLRKWATSQWMLGRYPKPVEQNWFQEITFSMFENSYHLFQFMESATRYFSGMIIVLDLIILQTYDLMPVAVLTIPLIFLCNWLGTQAGRMLLIKDEK